MAVFVSRNESSDRLLGYLPDGNGGWVDGRHEPLIGEELWDQAQAEESDVDSLKLSERQTQVVTDGADVLLAVQGSSTYTVRLQGPTSTWLLPAAEGLGLFP